MHIKDLLEHKLDGYVEYKNGEAKLKFDLAEDLVYFMNHDDESYRRHLYPTIATCLHRHKKNESIRPGIFKKAATDSYQKYLQQFPIRELPEGLDDKMIRSVCEKLHEAFLEGIREEKYKD
jgi:hypothetical protein